MYINNIDYTYMQAIPQPKGKREEYVNIYVYACVRTGVSGDISMVHCIPVISTKKINWNDINVHMGDRNK